MLVASSGSGTGSPGAIGREGEKETANWLWPLSSASIWDNKAWPAIGGRLRIASLDEGAEAHPDGGGKQGSGEYNRDADNEGVSEAAGSTDAGAGRGRCDASQCKKVVFSCKSVKTFHNTAKCVFPARQGPRTAAPFVRVPVTL